MMKVGMITAQREWEVKMATEKIKVKSSSDAFSSLSSGASCKDWTGAVDVDADVWLNLKRSVIYYQIIQIENN